MVDRITLDDIMTLISNEGKIIRTNGRTFQCECPSCHDRRGKFYVTLGEGYYCQRASCEFHGRDWERKLTVKVFHGFLYRVA